MSKIFKLKQWLRVPEAAKYLTGVCEEEVTESDVLRLALEGKLTLSVFFVNEAIGKSAVWVPFEQSKLHAEIMHDPDGETLAHENAEILESVGDIVTLSPILDLLMLGEDRGDVEHLFQRLTGGPPVVLNSLLGVFLQEPPSDYCHCNDLFQLHVRTNSNEIKALPNKNKLDQFYYPAFELPDDCIFVVRIAAINDFLEHFLELGHTNAEKPLRTKERNTLLTIIAALCDYSDIKYQERGAAIQISNMTQEIGAEVSDDTIRKVLAKIQNAIETRIK